MSPPERAGRWTRLRGWTDRHPLLVVGLISGLSALASLVVIWKQRILGTYDPDESGYLASALRYQRAIDPSAPLEVFREVSHTVTGPLVPFLSLGTLIIGPRDPRSAMAIQPVLMVFTAVAIAGIARRYVSPGYAILAGALAGGVPTMVLATESYWFGLGAAAGMAGAIWALVSSDRLENGWTWWYGVGIGAMLLARTMAIGFLPALLAGGLVLAWGSRRRLLRLGGACLVAAAVAGPWWVIRRHEIFHYLVGYGYGSEAANFGEANVFVRVFIRLFFLLLNIGLPGPFVIPLLIAAWVERARLRRAAATERGREVVALAVILVGGLAALASTQNGGVWFDLPLVGLSIVLMIVLLSRSPRWVRVSLGCWLVAVAVLAPVGVRGLDMLQVDGAAGIQDHRLAWNNRGHYDQAAAEWWSVNQRLTDKLGQLTDKGRTGIVTITGNSYSVNQNSIELAAELDSWAPIVEVPDTTQPASAWARDLQRESDQMTPRGTPKERILVIVRQDKATFPADRHWRRLDEQARRAGWRQVAAYPLPTSGEVAVLRMPGTRRAG